MRIKISRYFGRPELPWEFIYFTGSLVMLLPLFLVWVLTLGFFRPWQVISDWAAYCFKRESQD